MTEHDAQTDQPQVIKGLLAEFSDPDSLLSAAKTVRDTGVKRWDSYSPFPVHGIDQAMGIRRSGLAWLVLGAGITGGVVALLMQWWTNAVDYPLNISGKPLFSLPANIPVAFELIVLFAAFTAFLGALALNGLPRFNNPLFSVQRFARATSDRFFIAVDADDPAYDEARFQELFQSAGAISVERVEAPGHQARIPLAVHLFGMASFAVALVPILWIAADRAHEARHTASAPRTGYGFSAAF